MLFFLYGCGQKIITSVPVHEEMSSVKAMRVVETTKTQIGKPYKWGGTDPKIGFDCSGLLWWSFKQNNINIPRTTKDQVNLGKAINQNNLRAGDILVFNIKSGLHTGLYVGNKSFVHSPSIGKQVRQDKLDMYWQPLLIAARRVDAISAPR